MRGMGRQADGDDVVLLVIFLEFGANVALMAIKNQHPIATYPTAFGMLVEML